MQAAEQLINKIAGHYPCFSINERAARLSGFYTGFNFAVGAVMVLVMGLSGGFLLFQLTAAAVFFSVYYLLASQKHIQRVVYFQVVLLCMAFTVFWFYTGGVQGPAIISTVVIFYNCLNMVSPKHKITVSALVVLFMALTLWLSYLYPQWVVGYNEKSMAYLHYLVLFIQFSGYFILIETSNLYCYRYEQKLVIQQNQELEKANEAKLRLLAIISHDLRGPMATLKAILNSVEEGFATPEKTQRQLMHLKTMMNPLNNSLNNLLLWSRLQLEGLSASPEWFTAGEIIEEEIQIATAQAALAGVTLLNGIDGNLRLYADINHCRIVFRNLIANAVQNALPGTVVELQQQTTNGKTVFKVTNQGSPIPSASVEEFNLTGALPKAENSRKRQGLGLQLCNDFVKINGGHIWIETTHPTKTVFCFSFNAPE